MKLMTRYREWREVQRERKAIKDLAKAHLTTAKILFDSGETAEGYREMEMYTQTKALLKPRIPNPSEQFDTRRGCYPAPLTQRKGDTQ